MTHRIFGLDVLRATAIACVVVSHGRAFVAEGRLHRALGFGAAGVELFFVLSGFLIGGILLAELDRLHRPVAVAHFWMRRWLRTIPAYLLFLGVNAALWRWLGHPTPSLGSYASFTQAFAWPIPAFFDESWSLAVEEWFYLTFPLTLCVLLRYSRSPRSEIALGVIAGYLIIPGAARAAWFVLFDPAWDSGIRKVTILRLDAVMYGVLAAWVRWRHPERWARYATRSAWIGTIGAVALWTLLASGGHHLLGRWFHLTLFFSLFSLSFALLLPAAERWRTAATSLPVRATRAVARWSYSLYLAHLPVLLVLGWLPIAWWARWLAWTAAAVAVAAAAYRWWEKPWLDLRDRLPRPLSAMAPSSSQPQDGPSPA